MADQTDALDQHIPQDLDGVVWLLAYVVAGIAESMPRGALAPEVTQGLDASCTILSRTAGKLGHPEVARRFAAASDKLRG
jgi:hypothetical protein